MVPHALDARGRRAGTSEYGGNHSELKMPLHGMYRLQAQFQ